MTDKVETSYDVLIVGGGPAGQAAALELAAVGARCAVIDEQARPGGQILRQPPVSFPAQNWVDENSYRPLRQQLRVFENQAAIAWLGRRSVIGLQPGPQGHSLTTSGADGLQELSAAHVLIAAGCYDMPYPAPGWTLPGAMGAGAMQTLLKAQGIVTGEPIVFAGTHPLMLLIAAQISRSGGKVAEVAFDRSFATIGKSMIRHCATALRNGSLLSEAGKAMMELRRAGVPVRFGRPLQEITGADRVTGAVFGEADHPETTPCGSIGLCYGFLPQSDLPRQAGLAVRWSSPSGGWATCHDQWMQSSVEGVWVAGETTGVAGAPIARDEGRIAGLGIAAALGLITNRDATRRAGPFRQSRKAAMRFAAMLDDIADPTQALDRVTASNTTICRCEKVSASAVRETLGSTTDVNAVKRITRCGMGLCQGRNCEHMLIRMSAAAEGRPLETMKGFTGRFPARPVSIADLLDKPLP